MKQGHASAVFDAQRNAATVNFNDLCSNQAAEITYIIIESERYHDEQDPACMPHQFQAKLSRWEYSTTQIAEQLKDPYTALSKTSNAIQEWAATCRCLDKDWDRRISRHGEDTYLTTNINHYKRAGSIDPRAAALRAVEVQKSYAVLARAKAVDVFMELARTYKAEAITILDESAAKFEEISKHLDGIFNPASLRATLAQDVRAEDLANVKKPAPLTLGPDFY